MKYILHKHSKVYHKVKRITANGSIYYAFCGAYTYLKKEVKGSAPANRTLCKRCQRSLAKSA